jgi:hypothetical protein
MSEAILDKVRGEELYRINWLDLTLAVKFDDVL